MGTVPFFKNWVGFWTVIIPGFHPRRHFLKKIISSFRFKYNGHMISYWNVMSYVVLYLMPYLMYSRRRWDCFKDSYCFRLCNDGV